MNIIVVTGASSGMGKEFVLQMDKKFPSVDEFWLVARREKELTELKNTCHHHCRVMPLDITNAMSVELFAQYLEKFHVKIKVLVNCAGYGIYSPFLKSGMDEETGMIDLNCKALTAVTYCCLPYMAKNSRVIQLASSAAFLPQPNFAVYAATKSYVLSFTRALQEEYRNRGIYFTAVCPGPVETAFFDRAEVGYGTLAVKKYVMAKPEDVVAQALMDSRDGKIVSIYSTPVRIFYHLTKILPHGFLLFCCRFIKHSES